MKNKFIIRCAVLCMAILMTFAPVSASAATLLKRGAKGSEVTMIQATLKELGYYTYSKTTGFYGSITEKAVKRFQKANGIYPDGVVGKKTRGILIKSDKTSVVSGSAISLAAVDVNTQKVGDLDWFKEVRYLWDRGMDATVTDVATGKSFQVKRTYGTNHADVEPLTKDDTAVIKEIWGGFSWERRAVIVQFGNYTIAASMTSMAHAGVESAPAGKYVYNRSVGFGYGVNLDQIKGNGCSGVMDIHFKNSKTHTTNTVQKSQQRMVEKAADYIEIMSRTL